eukprot:6187718-Pleurochrysis_carterae.AAC.3
MGVRECIYPRGRECMYREGESVCIREGESVRTREGESVCIREGESRLPAEAEPPATPALASPASSLPRCLCSRRCPIGEQAATPTAPTLIVTVAMAMRNAPMTMAMLVVVSALRRDVARRPNPAAAAVVASSQKVALVCRCAAMSSIRERACSCVSACLCGVQRLSVRAYGEQAYR